MTIDVGGRPTVMTADVVNKLEEAFSIGASDIEACFIAGISKQTLYNYQKEYPEFVDRKEALKNMTSFAARKVVNDKIIEGDVDTAKWQLERKNKDEYGTKQTVDAQVSGSITLGKILADADGRTAGLPSIEKQAHGSALALEPPVLHQGQDRQESPVPV